MVGVALDLRRPALVALDERRRVAKPPSGIAVAKKSGLPGTMLLRLPHVGDDLLLGLLACRRVSAGERERRAHQLQELAPAGRRPRERRRPAAGTRGAGTPGTRRSRRARRGSASSAGPCCVARRARIAPRSDETVGERRSSARLIRWHVEQSVRVLDVVLRHELAAELVLVGGRLPVDAEDLARAAARSCSGWRWQSRHHSICSDVCLARAASGRRARGRWRSRRPCSRGRCG